MTTKDKDLVGKLRTQNAHNQALLGRALAVIVGHDSDILATRGERAVFCRQKRCNTAAGLGALESCGQGRQGGNEFLKAGFADRSR